MSIGAGKRLSPVRVSPEMVILAPGRRSTLGVMSTVKRLTMPAQLPTHLLVEDSYAPGQALSVTVKTSNLGGIDAARTVCTSALFGPTPSATVAESFVGGMYTPAAESSTKTSPALVENVGLSSLKVMTRQRGVSQLEGDGDEASTSSVVVMTMCEFLSHHRMHLSSVVSPMARSYLTARQLSSVALPSEGHRPTMLHHLVHWGMVHMAVGTT